MNGHCYCCSSGALLRRLALMAFAVSRHPQHHGAALAFQHRYGQKSSSSSSTLSTRTWGRQQQQQQQQPESMVTKFSRSRSRHPHQHDSIRYDCDRDGNPETTDSETVRRTLLQSLVLLSSTTTMTTLSKQAGATAAPLTTSTGSALVPIVQLQRELQSLVELTHRVLVEQQQQQQQQPQQQPPREARATTEDWSKLADRILSYDNNNKNNDKSPSSSFSIPTSETRFKSLFDAYSEPLSYKTQFMDQNAFLVYYTQGFDGPGRPSLEADTAAEARHKRQYGHRNDAWVAWDVVVSTISSPVPSSTVWEQDILEPLQETLAAVNAYLQDAPPADLERATRESLSLP
mmetsp:Transcript_2618/g.5476  ORF Transcript_2618/g.5476 Transcript_2618/m.5476 type:complete len:346 (-) Transcript_2618:617-1654(-)